MYSINASPHVAILGALFILAPVLHYTESGYTRVEAQQVAPGVRNAPSKILGFVDPHTYNQYEVVSFNVRSMTANSTVRSFIRVSRQQLNDSNHRQVARRPEFVQTIKFNPSLVDFDLHCSSRFCYLVAVTSKSKRNIELYAWQRTQFDLLSRRDSFARPHDVELFSIGEEFFIAVAQEQLHLSQYKLSQLADEPTRFIGNAILKFTRGNEEKIKYHQFIRLPYSPRHVNHLVSNVSHLEYNARSFVDNHESHILVFSRDKDWQMPGEQLVQYFAYSPVNGYFWPYRLPRGATLQKIPGPLSSGYTFRVPLEVPRLNMTISTPVDYTEAAEVCFNDLQRLLAARDKELKRLLDYGQRIWRPDIRDNPLRGTYGPKRIKPQVVVYGNVTVTGSLVRQPHVSLFGAQHLAPQTQGPIPALPPQLIPTQLLPLSPEVVDAKIAQAKFKLRYINDKLNRAVLSDSPNNSRVSFDSPIIFHGHLDAQDVILRGVANSDVHINGIPFKQLEHELVSLTGSQVIGPQVKFTGRVVADLLEINGLINGKYRLRDAIDITSRMPQVLEADTFLPIEFESLIAPDVRMLPNVTFNDIRLNDFITRDSRTQIVTGRKVFTRLSMDRLDLAHANVPLNGFNLTRISENAIHLREPNNMRNIFHGGQVNFRQSVSANKLVINNVINRHVNISLLIQDSVKTSDASLQQITGFKHFFNGLKINQLTTQSNLNGIRVDDIFNLNAEPPYARHGPGEQIISGAFTIRGPVEVLGNLDANLVNGVDIRRAAIRRGVFQSDAMPQIVRGHKKFMRPLRVIQNVTLLDNSQLNQLAAINISAAYPLINGLDLRNLSANLAKQMAQPAMVYIDNLEIVGNINLPTKTGPQNVSRAILGNQLDCPLDAVKSKYVLGGLEDQVLDVPMQIGTLRARSILVDQGAFNGLSFPQDFVLRTGSSFEPVLGSKSFQHLEVVQQHNPLPLNQISSRGVVLGPNVQINSLDSEQLRAFVRHESRQNSTGERVFNTINVHGNIYANRINGQSWPDDILLKSLGTVTGPPEAPSMHNRIYSPIVFTSSSFLDVRGQLVLRGPIKLQGRLNGINLTDFSRQAATYGDKELFYNGRPLTNKVFLGGISVSNQIRSQGLIDGVNLDEFKQRAVTINPTKRRITIQAPKVFMSDTSLEAPISMSYLDDVPIDKYLTRVRFQPDGSISIRGKKTITGALRISGDLYVDGLINGRNYSELRDKAISLSQAPGELLFNKTLIIEGDAFMDNLHVPQNGTIDGVRLSDLAPMEYSPVAANQAPSFNRVGSRGQQLYLLNDQPARQNLGDLMQRRPFSINYEIGAHRRSNQDTSRHVFRYTRGATLMEDMSALRHLLLPMDIFNKFNNLVIGFVDSENQDLDSYRTLMSEPTHADHIVDDLHDFDVLDQIDFYFPPAYYHLSAVVTRQSNNKTLTTIQSSIGGRPHELLTVLPIDNPNGAIFVSVAHDQALFLLISQDYTLEKGQAGFCPTSEKAIVNKDYLTSDSHNIVDGDVHVYLFNVLQNSSSFRSAYFDLYQTVDLPLIDSFEKFTYAQSTYALAVSRAKQRVYLLLLRGFSGFQVVSHVDSPTLEHIEVVNTADSKPAIVIYGSDGTIKIMESVIV